MQEIQGRVLIIDDHAELLFGLSVLLNSVGFEVDTVETGEDGLDRLNKAQYDVAVVDFRLPGMSGREFIECVRRQPATSQLPIIALTASVMKLQECMLAGATRGLNKPCKFDHLIAELRSVLAEVEDNSEAGFQDLHPVSEAEGDTANGTASRILTSKTAELVRNSKRQNV